MQGYRSSEIASAVRESRRIRQSRERSYHGRNWDNIHAKVEGTARKLQRVVRKSKSAVSPLSQPLKNTPMNDPARQPRRRSSLLDSTLSQGQTNAPARQPRRRSSLLTSPLLPTPTNAPARQPRRRSSLLFFAVAMKEVVDDVPEIDSSTTLTCVSTDDDVATKRDGTLVIPSLGSKATMESPPLKCEMPPRPSRRRSSAAFNGSRAAE